MATSNPHAKASKSTDKRRKSAARAKKPAEAITLTSLFPEYQAKQYSERLAKRREDFITDLRQTYLYRGLVLYLGAGVSRSIELPAWNDLVRALTVNMMSRKVQSAIDSLGGLHGEDSWERTRVIYEAVESNSGQNKPILMMARAIKDQLGDDLPRAVAQILYRPVWQRFRRTGRYPFGLPLEQASQEGMDKVLPRSPLVDAIISLARSERDVKGVQAIVNYNYDDLLDELLKATSVRCMTVRSRDDRLPHGTLPCYHVHGVLPVREFLLSGTTPPGLPAKKVDIGNFVFSEDEYHAEYASPYKWSNMIQMRLLGLYTGLFVGLSMEDPNIRRLIDATHQQYPDVVNYAILPRPAGQGSGGKEAVLRNLFEEVETESFKRIGVRIIWADNYAEIPKIVEQICQLDAGAPRPPSPIPEDVAKSPLLPGQELATSERKDQVAEQEKT